MSEVKVYGADWCGDTRRARGVLDRLGVAYDYINIEEDEESARWVREQNGGKERKPTIALGGGRVLTEPSDEELESALRQ